MSFCRNCGSALVEGESFCGNCGQPVVHADAGMQPAAAPPPTVPPAPAYTPPAAPPSYAPPAPPQATYAPPTPPPPAYPGYPPAPPYGSGQPYSQAAYGQPPRKRNNGLWIGLSAFLLVVVIACVLVFVVFRGDLFGKDGGTVADDTATTVATQPGQGSATGGKTTKDSPNMILAAATAAIGTAKSTSGTFALQLNIKTDTSVSADQAQMFKNPVTLSGSINYASDKQAGDFGFKIGMMGQTMDVGLRLLGDKAWIRLGEQWYESSTSTESQLANSGVSAKMDQVQQMFASLSIDPISWLKNQAAVKEETIDGVKCLHLSGSNPDWTKTMGDVAKITSSPAFQNLMSSAGSTVSSLESQLPSADQLAQMQQQLDAMFKNVQIDVWVEKDTSLLRKITIASDMVPAPQGTTSSGSTSVEGCDPSACDLAGSGVTGINLAASITLDPNQPVSVEAPASPKSYDQMQADIQANPALLGPFGTLLGGLSLGE